MICVNVSCMKGLLVSWSSRAIPRSVHTGIIIPGPGTAPYAPAVCGFNRTESIGTLARVVCHANCDQTEFFFSAVSFFIVRVSATTEIFKGDVETRARDPPRRPTYKHAAGVATYPARVSAQAGADPSSKRSIGLI